METPAQAFTLRASFRLPYSSIRRRRRPLALLPVGESTSYPLFSPNFLLTRIRLRSRPVVFTSTSGVPSGAHAALSDDDENDSDLIQNHISPPSGGKLLKDGTLIGLATLASKILGLLREIIIASTFGVCPVATAFKYSSMMPGFAMSLVGGVNGPAHIIMASILSKLPEDHQRKLFRQTKAIMFLVGGIAAALVFLFAEPLMRFYAPGLWFASEGPSTREMAIRQLRIMIPCIILVGPVGLGFGYMSAEGKHVLPAISPALSSLLLIASCVLGTAIGRSRGFLSVETLASYGASLGIFLQWIIQVIVLKYRWFNMTLGSWVDIMKNRHVHEFFSLLLPAIITLGLQHVASFTDLWCASLIPGGNTDMGVPDAYLLVMAPVGLLSSTIVLPLLPTFSKLTKAGSWLTLIKTLKQSALLSMARLLDPAALVCPVMLLLFCCIMSSFATFTSYEICKMFSSSLSKRTFWIKELFSIALAGALGVCSFFFPVLLLHFSGFTLIQDFFQAIRDPK